MKEAKFYGRVENELPQGYGIAFFEQKQHGDVRSELDLEPDDYILMEGYWNKGILEYG